MPFAEEDLDSSYPHLARLIGGYFHQDWSYEYNDSAQAALDDYIGAFRADVGETADEIDRLLARSRDAELSDVLDRLHNDYRFEHDGFTARTWLSAILMRLRNG